MSNFCALPPDLKAWVPEDDLAQFVVAAVDSVRYDRAKELRAKLAADIAGLTAQAEAADIEDHDPQALPAELARREALKAKLDAACERLEAEARADAQAARPEYEAKKAAHDRKTGRRGRPPKLPDDEPPPQRQCNLTDPDSALMRCSDGHEYRSAYNAQAVVCADDSQLILAVTWSRPQPMPQALRRPSLRCKPPLVCPRRSWPTLASPAAQR